MKNLFVLVADDDMDDCFLFEDAIKQLPVSTRLSFVHDGDQLMQHLFTFEPLPDIIFLDLNMPRKNGFTSLHEIKSNEKIGHIPVVVFSTSSNKNIIERLYEEDANYYITKPNDFGQLKKLILLAINKVTKTKAGKPSAVEFVLSAQDNSDQQNLDTRF